MPVFEVKEDFLLDGQPIKIISGALHYFRILPEHWEHSLYNLKALGFNTVETYIPWNFHERREGEFDFSGNKDVVAFIKKAQEIGLMVILRPGPYICAEWEFGGLPAWLLKDSLRIRTQDARFLEKVQQYFDVLFPLLVPLQITKSGPIIMMQIENEYGYFGNDVEYLRALKKMFLEAGIEVPLCTSDGAWEHTLSAGSLIEEDIFVTGNFGSRMNERADILENFMKRHGKQWPIMCMEFWCGWFNTWDKPLVKRDEVEVASCLKEMLKRGSVNVYMFQGGTNFGFMNGCCVEGNKTKAQVTSYDYDALLTEWGDPTPKYEQVKQVMKELFPSIVQTKPRVRTKRGYGSVPLRQKVSLFQTLHTLTTEVSSLYPLTMEQLGESYGYVLYETIIKGHQKPSRLKIVEANDRIQVYLDEVFQLVQEEEQMSQEFELILEQEHRLSLFVENTGRHNFGEGLWSSSVSKGIRGGVMVDSHFENDWKQYALSLENIEAIDFSGKWIAHTPAFYEYEFVVEVAEDTFLDCSPLGKGVAFMNGFNLGRYDSKGVIQYLYIPGPVIHIGVNRLVIFETEGVLVKSVELKESPTFKMMTSS